MEVFESRLLGFLELRFFGGGALDTQPWQYHLPRGTCEIERNENGKPNATNGWLCMCSVVRKSLCLSYLDHRRNVAVVMVGTRAQFAEDHFANRLCSMATTHNALAIACRLVHALVAIPATIYGTEWLLC